MSTTVKVLNSTLTSRVTWSVAAGGTEYLCNDRAHAIDEIRRLMRYYGPDEITVYRTTEVVTRSKVDSAEWAHEVMR